MRLIRQSPFALRVVNRREGSGAIVYRRRPDEAGRDRLKRVASIGAMSYTAGLPLLRAAVSRSRVNGQSNGRANGNGNGIPAGAFHPLDGDWGAKVASYAILAAGLRDTQRLGLAASHLRHADPTEAAWWLAMLTREDNVRAIRALRILTEAVD